MNLTMGSRVTTAGERQEIDTGTVVDFDQVGRRALVQRDLQGTPLGDFYWAPTADLLEVPCVVDELVALRAVIDAVRPVIDRCVEAAEENYEDGYRTIFKSGGYALVKKADDALKGLK